MVPPFFCYSRFGRALYASMFTGNHRISLPPRIAETGGGMSGKLACESRADDDIFNEVTKWY